MKYLLKLKKGKEKVPLISASAVKKFRFIDVIVVEATEAEAAALRKHPDVEVVEPDGKVHTLDYPDLEGIIEVLDYEAELDKSWGVKMIGTGFLHEKGILGKSVKIAVIDTGIDYTHPELSAAYKGGYNFIGSNADPKDDHGHGTHCAGVIAAAMNGQGVVGVAPEVELYALKVLDSSGFGNYSSIIAAIDWCIDNGIFITSNSYGGLDHSSILEDAFDAAQNAGILSVAAAGNSFGGGNIDSVNYPAKFSSVLAVAAVDAVKARAPFSSTGPTLRLAAPGVGITSCYPGSAYKSMSGTSMACPHVVGAAALVKSVHQGWYAENIMQILIDTAEDLGEPGRDWLYGYGLVNAALACGEVTPPTPPEPDSVYVHSIVAKSTGYTVEVTVLLSRTVNDAYVSLALGYETGYETIVSATLDGVAIFKFNGIPSGPCVATVTEITGYIWDKSQGIESITYNHKKSKRSVPSCIINRLFRGWLTCLQ